MRVLIAHSRDRQPRGEERHVELLAPGVARWRGRPLHIRPGRGGGRPPHIRRLLNLYADLRSDA